MDKKVVVGITASTLIVGFIAGGVVQSRVMRKRVVKLIPLMENAIQSVIINAIKDDLDESAISDLIAQEIRFMSVAIKEG